jgi:hypothetical protein
VKASRHRLASVTRARLALGLIMAAAAVSLVHALWVGEVTDDAGVSLAYARTFAQGQGLRLTPLSPRVEAYSNPRKDRGARTG